MGVHPPKPIMHFPPLSEHLSESVENVHNFPTIFVKFLCVLPHLCIFASPYFDHDAFMHHTIHVLDTPYELQS